jgi:hypothetical protein
MEKNLIFIGQVKFENGQIFCSDPCYHYDLAGYKDFAKIGTYNVYIEQQDFGKWGIRNTSLIVLHSDFEIDSKDIFLDYAKSICVDSGTMGIYDYDYFKNTHNDEQVREEWYKKNVLSWCDKKEWYITDEKGIVCTSGFGDGSYPIYPYYTTEFNFNNSIGIKIEFIEDEKEYDEESEDEII